jgi:DNA-directed RNA polymerase sigma subunit (sigma70/sigma32)
MASPALHLVDAHRRLVHFDSLELPLSDLLRRMRYLSGPERDVLELRIGLGRAQRSVEEASRELGMSQNQVRQIESIACAKLRHPSTAA